MSLHFAGAGVVTAVTRDLPGGSAGYGNINTGLLMFFCESPLSFSALVEKERQY